MISHSWLPSQFITMTNNTEDLVDIPPLLTLDHWTIKHLNKYVRYFDISSIVCTCKQLYKLFTELYPGEQKEYSLVTYIRKNVIQQQEGWKVVLNSQYALETAVKNGYLKTLQWMKKRKLLSEDDLFYVCSSSHHHLNKWIIHDHPRIVFRASAYIINTKAFYLMFYKNLEYGFVDLARSIVIIAGDRFELGRMISFSHTQLYWPVYRIAVNGHLDSLKYLSELGLPAMIVRGGLSNKVFIGAVGKGHFHIGEWFLETFKAETDTKTTGCAFQEAASNGNLTAMQWLKEKFNLKMRTVGREKHHAFRQAALRGHLHVLEWILSNYDWPEEKVKEMRKIAEDAAVKYARKYTGMGTNNMTVITVRTQKR